MRSANENCRHKIERYGMVIIVIIVVIIPEVTRTKAKTRMGVLAGTLSSPHVCSQKARLTVKVIAQDVYFHDSCPATTCT